MKSGGQSNVLIIAAGLVLLAALGAGAYYFGVLDNDSPAARPPGTQAQPAPGGQAVPLTGRPQGAAAPNAARPRPSGPPLPVPQPLAETFGGWRVQCMLDVQSRQDCRAEYVVRGDNRQAQLAVVVRAGANGGPGRLGVLPPWGVLIQPGLAVRVDTGPTVRIPIATCQPTGCQAETALTDGFLGALRQGTTLNIGMTTSDNRAAGAAVPLEGFADAYARLLEKASR